MTKESATRERFEKWAIPRISLAAVREGDGYAEVGLNVAWSAWQAATEGQQELVEALNDILDICVYNNRLGWDSAVQRAEAVLARYGK